MSKHYSIYEAKAKFSELLRQVKSGVEVVVTDRGIPVARVVALPKDESLENHVERLLESGLMAPPRNPGAFPKGEKRKGATQRFLKDRK